MRVHPLQTPTLEMYGELYAAYDAIIRKEAEERKRLRTLRGSAGNPEERSRRAILLERKRQRLSELPALSSMILISEAEQQLLPPHDDSCTSSLQEKQLQNGLTMDGFERMRLCRQALDALDVAGWKRSYHQRLFHEAYIAACARPFWKLDPPGSFARAHQKILDVNNWDNLAQVHRMHRCSASGDAYPIDDHVKMAGNPHLHSETVRKDHLSQHVCCSPHVLMCR